MFTFFLLPKHKNMARRLSSSLVLLTFAMISAGIITLSSGCKEINSFKSIEVNSTSTLDASKSPSNTLSTNTTQLTDTNSYGSLTLGGLKAGTRIIKVTNLNDSGPGSFLEALQARGPRIVVFEVGGTIWLTRGDYNIKNPDLTIAGETAPSPGITIANGAIRIGTHDVIVRHIRIRVGDDISGTDYDNRDGLEINGSDTGAYSSYNILIDHCSISWAVDENLSTWFDNVHDITIRNSIISEALWLSGHSKGRHSMGFLIGNATKRVLFIRNLLAHNADRNPLLKGNTSATIVNNAIYNSTMYGIHISEDDMTSPPTYAQVIGNVYKPGPNTVYPKDAPLFYSNHATPGSQAYMAENFSFNTALFAMPYAATSPLVSEPIGFLPVPFQLIPTENVLEWVTTNAGARPKDRDSVDIRVTKDVRNGTGSIIDSQKQVGGWPSKDLAATRRTLSVPTQPLEDDNHNGMTNAEEFLNSYLSLVE